MARRRANQCLRRTLIKCLVSDTVAAFTAVNMTPSLDLCGSRLDLGSLPAVSDDATCKLDFTCFRSKSLFRCCVKKFEQLHVLNVAVRPTTDYVIMRTAAPW